METYSKTLSPEEVLEILKQHFQVKDARVGCYVDRGCWQGLWFAVYDKPEKKES